MSMLSLKKKLSIIFPSKVIVIVTETDRIFGVFSDMPSAKEAIDNSSLERLGIEYQFREYEVNHRNKKRRINYAFQEVRDAYRTGK